MNFYSAYGLTVRSAFELPELHPVEDNNTPVDVVFERGTVEPVAKSVEGYRGRRIEADPDRCRLSYDSIGSFLVDDGKRVRFDPASEDVVGTKLVRRLFENEMLGVLLHQRGRLVLHASAVSIDGEVALFLGPRGAGKSTTAAAFYTQGYSIMEDDIVSVRFEGQTPTVDPGVPELRLKPDAVDALGFKRTTSYPNDGNSGKRYQPLDGVPEPAPLTRCYVLRTGESLGFEPISERDRLFTLIQNTYTQGLLPDTHQTGDHFQQCSAIVETVSFRKLERPDELIRLADLVNLVIKDVEYGD